MNIAKFPAELSLWSSRLGLLPVPLFAPKPQSKSFIMLNGTSGNFCLDIGKMHVDDKTRNHAWSSNVGHYLSIIDNAIEVQRWDQGPTGVLRFRLESVKENLEGFHTFLERNAPRPEISIISHGLATFRKFWGSIQNEANGVQALKGFLYLLACASQQSSRNKVNLKKWGLSNEAKQIAFLLNDLDWNALQHELLQGRPIENLKPELDLLIRHASGQLFQVAHYEASVFRSDQMRLGGFLPAPVPLHRKSGSEQNEVVGLHFTPAALARALVEHALFLYDSTANNIVIFDPACGSGEFLREALRQLVQAKYKGAISIIGWDKSSAACEMASFVLTREVEGILPRVSLDIQNVDSLHPDQIWPENVDLLLMNPPFLSWENMNLETREQVSESLGNLAGRSPDLLHAFVIKAAVSTRAGGILATIVPSSFLEVDSAEKIRRYLAERLSAKLIARLGNHKLFSDAVVDAAFYIAKKDTSGDEPAIAFWADNRASSNSSGLRTLRKIRYFPDLSILPVIGEEEGYSIYPNPDIGHIEGSWSPRPYTAWELSKRASSLPRVGELFDLKQGVRTGSNSTFLLTRFELLELPAEERNFFRPALVNRSLQNGRLNDDVHVFFPYGENEIKTEDSLKERLSHYYHSYLLPAKDTLVVRSKISIERWWELSRCTAWHKIRQPKLVSTAYGDAGSFAWDEKGDFVIVQGLGWLPRNLGRKKQLSRKVTLAYLAILNSKIFSLLLLGASRQVGGGQFDLSEQYVSGIPLPNIYDAENIDEGLLDNLYALGAKMHQGKVVEVDKLNEFVSVLYGVTEVL